MASSKSFALPSPRVPRHAIPEATVVRQVCAWIRPALLLSPLTPGSRPLHRLPQAMPAPTNIRSAPAILPAARGQRRYFYFRGVIDGVEFFSRALSLAEVQAIFSTGSTGKCKSLAPVAKCRNISVTAGPAGSADASIDDGSFSPVPGRTITLSQAPPGPYSLGDTLVTLTATDTTAAASRCTGTATAVSAAPSPCGSPVAMPNVFWPPNDKRWCP